MNNFSPIYKAIEQSPSNSDLYHQLGLACYEQKLFSQAIEAWEKAVSLEPGFMDARASLGLCYSHTKQYHIARKILTQGVHYQKNHIPCLINLALAWQMDGYFKEASEWYQKILAIDAGHQKALFGYGKLLYQTGNYQQAIHHLKRLIEINPNFYQAIYELGCAYQDSHLNIEAMNCFQSIIKLKPDYAPAYYNLGKICQISGHLSLAEDFFKLAIQVKKDFAEVYASLGVLYLDRADIHTAQSMFLESFQQKHDVNIFSVYLYFLNFIPDIEKNQTLAYHQEWGTKLSSSHPICSHRYHDFDPTRVIKIGYVSPDFREHSVFYFIFPLLIKHDRKRFKIYIYSNVQKKDHLTDKIQALGHKFRDIRGMSASAAARCVQKDGIDILVDLAGHTQNHRLDLFAFKPAPLQVTYIGYPNTTGLCQMDYRITDTIADPINDCIEYPEKLIRLEPPFLCYSPPEDLPEISRLPFLKNQYITFGSFNYLGKINTQVIQTWSELMKKIPDSRLI
ncbi:MAG: tetratricopeptide repeat protein, partial [Candidatus Magnetomorum sp.]|nr:tetratricopeptide repeat protein [Candidatus Magnetomorum sp.]